MVVVAAAFISNSLSTLCSSWPHLRKSRVQGLTEGSDSFSELTTNRGAVFYLQPLMNPLAILKRNLEGASKELNLSIFMKMQLEVLLIV